MSIISQYLEDITTTFALSKLGEIPDAMSNLWILYLNESGLKFNESDLGRSMRISNISNIPNINTKYYSFNFISNKVIAPLYQTTYSAQEILLDIIIDQDYEIAQELHTLAYKKPNKFNCFLYLLKPYSSSLQDSEYDEYKRKVSIQMQEDEKNKGLITDKTTNTTNIYTEKRNLLSQLEIITKQFKNSQIAQGLLATIKDGINSGWLLSNKNKHITRDLLLMKDAFTESILEDDKILSIIDTKQLFGLTVSKIYSFNDCIITSFKLNNNQLTYKNSNFMTCKISIHFDNIKKILMTEQEETTEQKK